MWRIVRLAEMRKGKDASMGVVKLLPMSSDADSSWGSGQPVMEPYAGPHLQALEMSEKISTWIRFLAIVSDTGWARGLRQKS